MTEPKSPEAEYVDRNCGECVTMLPVMRGNSARRAGQADCRDLVTIYGKQLPEHGS